MSLRRILSGFSPNTAAAQRLIRWAVVVLLLFGLSVTSGEVIEHGDSKDEARHEVGSHQPGVGQVTEDTSDLAQVPALRNFDPSRCEGTASLVQAHDSDVEAVVFTVVLHADSQGRCEIFLTP